MACKYAHQERDRFEKESPGTISHHEAGGNHDKNEIQQPVSKQKNLRRD